MPQHLFLSHDSRDQALANAIATALQRLTLGQISVWHSSDGSGHGGLRPGQVWLDEIRAQLAKSRAVVALLTPRSIAKPWLLFESGFGAANAACDVIPVCVGIDSLASVPFPLAMYQTYQLADYDSVKRFAVKLFAKYEIQFDEEMCKPVVASLIRELVEEPRVPTNAEQPPSTRTFEEAVDELKAHIDRRLLEAVAVRSEPVGSSPAPAFSITVNLRQFTPKSAEQYLEVDSQMSVQDVLDAVYYMLPDMPAFRYLSLWMLRDSTAQLNLVLREIGARIPAHVVFSPGSRWEVVKLRQPYSPQDSQDAERWYGRH